MTYGANVPKRSRAARRPDRDDARAWAWEDYETWLATEWASLLDTADSMDEFLYSDFLEQHPCLLPGGEGTGDSFGGHHGNYGHVVISQPVIPGVDRRIPDFMWLTKNSEELIPVLIELEAPGKDWFNKDGSRSAKLTRAQDQVAEWRDLLEHPATRQQFADLYEFPLRSHPYFRFAPRYVLIYGRRREFSLDPLRRRGRLRVGPRDVATMTFDRLRPLAGARRAACVRVTQGRRRVVAVPPTFQLGPSNASTVASCEGWEEAITGNRLLSAARKEFLLSRLDHWRELALASRSGRTAGPAGSWE